MTRMYTPPTSPPRAYPVSKYYPTEGPGPSAKEIERLLETLRTTWDKWLALVTAEGPTVGLNLQMMVRIGTEIQFLEHLRQQYFHYPPSKESQL
jgi:hypothetical protein